MMLSEAFPSQKEMQSDLEVLSVVCLHFKQFEAEDVRLARNKARRLERALLREKHTSRTAQDRAQAWRIAAQAAEERYRALLTAVRQLGRS